MVVGFRDAFDAWPGSTEVPSSIKLLVCETCNRGLLHTVPTLFALEGQTRVQWLLQTIPGAIAGGIKWVGIFTLSAQ